MSLIFLAFRNLFRNVRRTIAIILTVGLGAGALFSFEGFIQGIQDDYKDSTIHSHYGNGQVNTVGYRDTNHDEPWKHWITNYNELEDHLYELDGVDYVFPRISIAGMLKSKTTSVIGQGQGILPAYEAEFFHSLNIEEGSIEQRISNGILLGKGLAESLDVKIGDQIKFYTKTIKGKNNSGKFRVTGIFSTGMVDYDNRAFRMPLKKAQQLLKTNRIETVSIGLSDHVHWKDVADSVEDDFYDLEAVSFAVLDKIWYQNSMDWLNAQFRVVQIIILSIVLLGIFNTISSSVLERKQEIGNLRANGESGIDVIRLIVVEGFFLGFLGAIVGLSLTYGVAKGFLHEGILMPPGPGQSKQFFLKFEFNWQMLVSALSLSVLSATFASLFAGMKVCRMSIAKALRSY